MQIMPLLSAATNNPSPGGGNPALSSSGSGSLGNLVTGDTQYPYRTFPQPYSGVPSNLVTRQGTTLQPGAMRSLVDIARASNVLPGIREIAQIDQGYRTYEDQVAGYAQAPGRFAPPGRSYHGQGLAMDAAFWSEHPELARGLAQAGWSRFSPSGEPWHWSYGVTG